MGGHGLPSSMVSSASTSAVGASAQSGLIPSPAAAPIPANLVQRIQSGQFIEMRDLLADNIALLNQLSSLQGTVPLPLAIASRTCLREVPSLASWLYCFNTYIAVRTSDPVARDMLSYSRFLIREALRHGGSGWLEYDWVFRRQMAINPLLSWNTVEPGLQAATIFSQGPSLGTFCSLCRECDHSSSQCALAPIQQPILSNPQQVSSSGASQSSKCPETSADLCQLE